MSHLKTYVEQTGAVDGLLLKFAKGLWTLGGMEIETGSDGIQVAVILDTVVGGEVCWIGGEIVQRNVGFLAKGFVPPRVIREGWDPYIEVLAVGASDEWRGQILTFRSSSRGSKNAIDALMGPFVRLGERQYPLCTLSSIKVQRGQYTVWDPVFVTVSWADRANFPGLAGPPAQGELEYFSDPEEPPPPDPDDPGAPFEDYANRDYSDELLF